MEKGMQTYVCRDLVCKDHRGSGRMNKNAPKESMTHLMAVSLFNLRVIFECIFSVLRGKKRHVRHRVSDQSMSLSV